MIGKIKGKILEIDYNTALIETPSGLSYHTFITPSILSKIKTGEQVEFYTYLQVREDAFNLYSFETKEEKDFFNMLLSVPSVGPRTAYLVISYGKVTDLINAIKQNNVDFFLQIKGLGRKTAMKIILELSQKLKESFEIKNMYLSDDDKIVIDALVSLGFKSHNAFLVIRKLPRNLSVENKIKEALKIIK